MEERISIKAVLRSVTVAVLKNIGVDPIIGFLVFYLTMQNLHYQDCDISYILASVFSCTLSHLFLPFLVLVLVIL